MSTNSGSPVESVLPPEMAFSGNRYAVVDNVFTEEQLQAILLRERRELEFSISQSPVNPLFDGSPQRSSGQYLSSILDDAARERVARAVSLAGRSLSMDAARPYDQISFWRYPQGCGLDWHDDGGDVGGAVFIIYISPEWRATWGGELELIDSPVDDVPCQFWDLSKDLMNAPGPRICVAPRPNRLVVMKTSTFHRLRAVHARAGDSLRQSITGFVSS
ncbi:2OG-Fe(II) oxygenase [Dermacoccus nishinomiyaensis]